MLQADCDFFRKDNVFAPCSGNLDIGYSDANTDCLNPTAKSHVWPCPSAPALDNMEDMEHTFQRYLNNYRTGSGEALTTTTPFSYDLLLIERAFEAYLRHYYSDPAAAAAAETFPLAPWDLLGLAHWIFGPWGLPELQILAYGDFSYHGRYEKHNLLLCRSSPASTSSSRNATAGKKTEVRFRRVTEEDEKLWKLVMENWEFLEACPVDTIMKV